MIRVLHDDKITSYPDLEFIRLYLNNDTGLVLFESECPINSKLYANELYYRYISIFRKIFNYLDDQEMYFIFMNHQDSVIINLCEYIIDSYNDIIKNNARYLFSIDMTLQSYNLVEKIIFGTLMSMYMDKYPGDEVAVFCIKIGKVEHFSGKKVKGDGEEYNLERVDVTNQLIKILTSLMDQ